MSAFRKGKKVITLVLCATLLLTLFFSIFTILNLQTKKRNSETNATTEQQGFTFGKQIPNRTQDNPWDGDDLYLGRLSEDYFNNDNFYIDTAFGLYLFSLSVSEGCDFSGKNVYLMKDIDYNTIRQDVYASYKTLYGENDTRTLKAKKQMENENVGIFFESIGLYMDDEWNYTTYNFSGHFDGNYKTISNLNQRAYMEEENVGFFCCLSGNATVQNVRISNYTIKLISSTKASITTNVGGIAGSMNGSETSYPEVFNCVVEQLNILGDISRDSNGFTKNIGGIIGNANGAHRVTDCYVEDFNVNISEYVETTGTYGTVISGIVGNAVPSASNTVLAYNLFKSGDWKVTAVANAYNQKVYKHPISSNTTYGYSNNCFLGFSGYTPESSAYSVLDKDIWYHSDSFNGGVPYVRGFIDFIEFKFESDGNGYIEAYKNGYIEDDNIALIAKEETEGLIINLKNRYLELGETRIVAIAKDGYIFDEWEARGLTFVAKFKKISYKLKIEICYLDNYTWESVDKEMEVYCYETYIVQSAYSSNILEIKIDEEFIFQTQNKFEFAGYEIGRETIASNNIYVPYLGDDGTESLLVIYLKLKEYGIEVH